MAVGYVMLVIVSGSVCNQTTQKPSVIIEYIYIDHMSLINSWGVENNKQWDDYLTINALLMHLYYNDD